MSGICEHCGKTEQEHSHLTSHCPAQSDKMLWSQTTFEAMDLREKAAHTADMLLEDLKALYPSAKSVAEELLFYSYIEQVATIRGTLGRIAADNILK